MERLLNTVDKHGRDAGVESVENAHRIPGIRHRAFSIVIVDKEGRHLLQKRSGAKKVFGEHWANACCSHDYVHYTERDLEMRIARASTERLEYETGIRLGITPEMKVGVFEYRTHLKGPYGVVSAAIKEGEESLEDLMERNNLEPVRGTGYGEWERDIFFAAKVSREQMDKFVLSQYNTEEVSEMRAVTLPDMRTMQRKAPWLMHITDLFFYGKSESIVSSS